MMEGSITFSSTRKIMIIAKKFRIYESNHLELDVGYLKERNIQGLIWNAPSHNYHEIIVPSDRIVK